MTQLTPQTQEQHDKAQQAGNDAYDAVFVAGRWNVRSAVEAYQAAYQASLAEQQNANPKRIIAVQHINGTVEIDDVRLGYIDKAHMIIDEAQAVADAKMAEYAEYKLTHQPLTGDTVNDALITSANEHNVTAFEWRRTHPDWRTRR